MKNQKDKWIDEVLDSTAGIEPAVPADGLYLRVMDKIGSYKAVARTIPITTMSVAAACLLVLIAINFAIISDHSEKPGSGNAIQEIARYYDLESNNAYNL